MRQHAIVVAGQQRQQLEFLGVSRFGVVPEDTGRS